MCFSYDFMDVVKGCVACAINRLFRHVGKGFAKALRPRWHCPYLFMMLVRPWRHIRLKGLGRECVCVWERDRWQTGIVSLHAAEGEAQVGWRKRRRPGGAGERLQPGGGVVPGHLGSHAGPHDGQNAQVRWGLEPWWEFWRLQQTKTMFIFIIFFTGCMVQYRWLYAWPGLRGEYCSTLRQR